MSRFNDTLSRMRELANSQAVRKAAPIVLLIASLFVAPWQPLLTPFALIAFVVLSAIVAPGKLTLGKAIAAVVLGSIAYGVLTGAIALGLIPLIHAITSAGWSLLPETAFVLLGVGATFAIGRWVSPKRKQVANIATWSAVVLLVVATGYMNYAQWAVEWQMREAVDAQNLDKLPESINDRLVPRLTAREFIENANKDNRLVVPAPHLLETANQDVVWQSALNYDVWYGRIFGSVARVIRVDASRTEMHADMDSGQAATFLFGDQSWVTDATFKLHHPFSEPGERVYWRKADGEWVLLISYVSKRPTLTGTMVPYIAGVMEISRSGWVTNHSVRESAQLFPGAPMFPPALARQYAEAYAKWHGGLFSRAVTQANILQISEEPTNDPNANHFPYLQHFRSLGLQEVIPLEPSGSSSFALVEILFFDAGTGTARVYVVPKEQVMNGPRKAIENVRKADPNADWSHRREVEPRLISGPTGFFWLVGVVQNLPEKPNNHAYIMSVLVDGYTLSSTRVDTADDLSTALNAGK